MAMRGFRLAVTAAVASAMVVAAVAALDAMGAEKTKANGDDPLIAAFASCLRDHGVQVPALTGASLGRWLKTQEIPGDAARACKTSIGGAPPPSDDRAANADAAKIAACLRDHGFDPPTDPVALKQWIAKQSGTAFRDALTACGMAPPSEGGCGDHKPAPPPDRGKPRETRFSLAVQPGAPSSRSASSTIRPSGPRT
jgi:hypothetical protein